MTKKEIYEAAMLICDNHNLSDEIREGFSELLKPKKGGASVNIDEVFVELASDGKSYLQCSVSGLFMEATVENFYEDKNNENNKTNGLKRLSRAAEAARKKHLAVVKATNDNVMKDLIAGNITSEEAQATLDSVAGPDYSGIEGFTEKPE